MFRFVLNANVIDVLRPFARFIIQLCNLQAQPLIIDCNWLQSRQSPSQDASFLSSMAPVSVTEVFTVGTVVCYSLHKQCSIYPRKISFKVRNLPTRWMVSVSLPPHGYWNWFNYMNAIQLSVIYATQLVRWRRDDCFFHGSSKLERTD